MRLHPRHSTTAWLLFNALPILCLSVCVSALAADKPKAKAAEPEVPAWEQPQPAIEKIDYTAYMRIREEGLQHSHIMEYASALADGIGPRLTGSANLAKANAWTRDQLAAMGCANPHLEDWGEFGMGWQQLNTWVRMTSPDTAIFNAQATPWSPATNGPLSGPAIWVNIQDEKDFDQYKGKLAGKIVFLGEMREVPPPDKPFFTRYTDKELEDMANDAGEGRYSMNSPAMQARMKAYFQRMALADKIPQFLTDEKALAVIRPSRDGANGGGTGIIFDDNGASLGRKPYTRDGAVKIPVIVAQIESWGRVYRLLQAHVPVTIEADVETKFTGDHEHGFDTVAEIPGTDPELKDQIVMVGGHLDSWIAGTGATDNGAGTVVAMEVMRILKALDVHPRRTIRVALWTGEEQGLFGSQGYAKMHFGSAPEITDPEQLKLPSFMRTPGGPLELRPEQKLVSAYFNIDNGTGKVRGIYLQQNLAVRPIFEQWIAPLKDLGVTTITAQNTGGTDHLSFDAVGIPGFQFIQDEGDYETRTHHSNMDTYEHLQSGDLKQAATVEAIFVYNAAMRDQMLPRKPLPHPELNKQKNAPLPNLFLGAEEPSPK
jgi:carboxypeptidase Q